LIGLIALLPAVIYVLDVTHVVDNSKPYKLRPEPLLEILYVTLIFVCIVSVPLLIKALRQASIPLVAAWLSIFVWLSWVIFTLVLLVNALLSGSWMIGDFNEMGTFYQWVFDDTYPILFIWLLPALLLLIIFMYRKRRAPL
jgi:hypothetical protein